MEGHKQKYNLSGTGKKEKTQSITKKQDAFTLNGKDHTTSANPTIAVTSAPLDPIGQHDISGSCTGHTLESIASPTGSQKRKSEPSGSKVSDLGASSNDTHAAGGSGPHIRPHAPHGVVNEQQAAGPALITDGVSRRLGAGNSAEKFVLAVDVGTTSVRAIIYNSRAEPVASDSRKIELLYPQPGWVEMDEAVLWQQVQDIIKGALTKSGLKADDISCMGITCQRNTFICIDKETGKPFHRFITWQDMRASDLVREWMNSVKMKAFNKGSLLIYCLTGSSRYLAASVLRFKSAQVTLRLVWQIEHDQELKRRVTQEQVMCGTIDTFLVWKLTGGKVFATDYSNASSTGYFDPFSMEYSSILSRLVGLPLHILAELRDTSGDFGQTDSQLFGAPIKITAVVADQQAAMFGQCCFNVGDTKCTMGTGTFIDCNTGRKPHASIAGLYPLVGWKIGDEITYVAEGYSSDTGLCIEWAQKLGMFEYVSEIEQAVLTVPDSGGTFFIPAFNGIQAPINDDKACCSLIGLNQSTTKAHIMRAILESLAFRVKLLYETIQQETKTPLAATCKCDGGVSNNNFLIQLVSDLIDVPLDRPHNMETTSLGAAYLAGLAVGVWKSKEELRSLRATTKVFSPDSKRRRDYQNTVSEWRRALKRSQAWYSNVPT